MVLWSVNFHQQTNISFYIDEIDTYFYSTLFIYNIVLPANTKWRISNIEENNEQIYCNDFAFNLTKFCKQSVTVELMMHLIRIWIFNRKYSLDGSIYASGVCLFHLTHVAVYEKKQMRSKPGGRKNNWHQGTKRPVKSI